MSAETVPVPLPSPVPPKPGTPKPRKYTVAEYCAIERMSEVRLEYVDGYIIPKAGIYLTMDGEIRAMLGESPAHNRIAFNISVLLDRAFEDRKCEVYIENVKVRIGDIRYRFPDVLALCGEAQFDDDNPPALTNPSLIVEVLFPSTQSLDRAEKFFEYRQIPTLQDYVLVAQDRVSAVHYVRRDEREWSVMEYSAPMDTLRFESLEVSLTLGELYRKVTLPTVGESSP